jgi:hypothetical protein
MLLEMPDRQVFIIAATDGSSNERWPRTSITGENSDRVDALIRGKKANNCPRVVWNTEQQ